MSSVPNPAWGSQATGDRLGYDGAGRMITKRYLDYGLDGSNGYSDTEAEVGFTTAYDLSSNKRYERHLHAENRSHLYPSLDSLDRLREYQRGDLSLDSGGRTVTVSSPITLVGTETQRTYELDGVGNWNRTDYTTVLTGGGTSDTEEVRVHNQANQVTQFGSTGVLYDGSPYAKTLLSLVSQEPKGYWRLGEDSGITADDDSGNSHDGTYLPNASSEWTGGELDKVGALAGNSNTAAEFDASSSGRVTISDHADFNFGSAMTAVVWIKGSTQDTKTVAGHWEENGDDRSWRLRSGTGGHTDKIRVELSSNGSFGSGYRKSYRSSLAAFDGEWRMVAFTFDSGSAWGRRLGVSP